MRLLVLLVAIASSALAKADAGTVDAREHYRRGTNAFNLGHYLDAVKEYEAAYQLKEDPALLFNIAQAYRLAGENEAAVRVYKSFLHQVPDSPQRPEVEKRIAELQSLIEQQQKTKEAPPEGTLPPKQTTATEPAAQPTAAPVTPKVQPPSDMRRPWYRDPAAMTMAAIGVAALGVGIGLTVVGNLDLSHASTAADLQDHDNLRSSGIALSAAGYATLGVGAALCIAAAVKWAVRPSRKQLALGIGTTGSTSTIVLGGRF